MNGLVLHRRAREARYGSRSSALLAVSALLVLGACSSSPPVDVDDSAGTRADGATDQPRGDASATQASADKRGDAGARQGAPSSADGVAPDVLDASLPGAPGANRGEPGSAAQQTDAAGPRSLADAQAASAADAASAAFVLTPVGFPSVGAELTFPESANPPTNVSPEFRWTSAPAGTKSLALVFRDLGNGAVKWILWDIPPTLTGVPPGISKTAMPVEVPGSSQLGSLNNQGYAGPGSGARQYDFRLWALDVERLPGTAGLTTVQIHEDVISRHAIATTAPVLLRNTHNAP